MMERKKEIAKVKAQYPKAKVNRDGALFFCHDGLKDLGAGFSEEAAWKSAEIALDKTKITDNNGK